MLSFKEFVTESQKTHSRKPVDNFLFHLSGPSTSHNDEGLKKQTVMEGKSLVIDHAKKPVVHTGHPVAKVISAGAKAASPDNPIKRMKEGFHAAIVPGEHPDVTKAKAKEAQTHFRGFMHARGGHNEGYSGDLTVENGKTRLSTGVGMSTIGISMAPHTKAGLNGFNVCPRASTECATNCLGVTAGGNKQYPEASLRRKVLVTQYATEHPEHFGRLLSHEISANEKWSHKNGMKSGVRLNITSDLPYEKLMPKHFFERHKDSTFYDYTKLHHRLDTPRASNYHLALSHTGANHAESNDTHVVNALNKGHVVAMVHERGKHVPEATHVEDVKTGKRWPITNGDDDDNVFDRHAHAGVPKGHGVVSGLKLKGVTAAAAGHFANKVDHDGVIRINKGNK